LDNHSQEEFLADEPIRRASFTHLPLGEASVAMPLKNFPLQWGLSFGPWSDLTWEGSRTSQEFKSQGTIWSLVPALSWRAWDNDRSTFHAAFSLPILWGKQDSRFTRVAGG